MRQLKEGTMATAASKLKVERIRTMPVQTAIADEFLQWAWKTTFLR
jgi:hypothetical protein